MAGQQDLALWFAPESAVPVEYSTAVLDQVRLEALEGFYAFPRGGAEVGGVLYGAYANGRVAVSAHRPLHCEHAAGPGFVLSGNDCERLAELLRAPRVEPSLEGLAPVGWYHSHTRSGIFLSSQDLELHERFFREPWQVALVLRPSIQGTRAAFFVRNAAGAMAAEPHGTDFALEPLAGRALAAHAPVQPETQEAAPATAPTGPPPEPPVSAPARPLPVPAFAVLPRARPRRRRYLLAAAALAALAAAAFATRAQWRKFVFPPPPAEVPALALHDNGGDVEVRWNPRAPAVRKARAGSLTISDGSARTVLQLDPLRLSAGSFHFARRSQTVEVALELQQPGGARAGESAKLPGGPLREDTPREAELRRELERARTQMINQALQIRRLEAEVEKLRASQ